MDFFENLVAFFNPAYRFRVSFEMQCFVINYLVADCKTVVLDIWDAQQVSSVDTLKKKKLNAVQVVSKSITYYERELDPNIYNKLNTVARPTNIMV